MNDRRIFGLETEYGVQHWHPEGRRLSPEEVARYLFRPVVEWGRSSNVFVENGSRLYLDVGSHPEYATAECSTIDELLASDAAGDEIMRELIAQAEERMHADGIEGSVYLYRNNADSAGSSYGSHENYLLRRRSEYRRLTEALVPFLVSRQILVGAGRVVPAGVWPEGQGQAHYAFSQRADFVQEGVSSSTTRSRPIINTRDEPHADASRYRRLHVIVGDSNLSEHTHLLRFGATDLMLRMIESGWPLGDKEMPHPTLAIRRASHDLTGTAPLQLRDGAASALELQEHYLERAHAFVERHGAHHDRVDQVLDLWEEVLEAVRSQDTSGIDTRIDWAIKLRLLEDYRARHGLDWSSPRLAQLDLAFHDLARGRGLFQVLLERGRVDRVIDPAAARRARTEPPSGTRAAVRAAFIRRARERQLAYAVDWTTMKLNEHPLHVISMKDPFDTSTTAVERLFDGVVDPA
ncbi:Pup ligase PafA, possible component of postulated heterodimer PafA-PafA' [Micrococcus lylae]|uniref:Pup--protein ligase n=1 Tax=Micrococcus lylae TaxID=1273 RepID=A0A1R4I8I5_9MICC|nr:MULTISPECIES: Pup--protein ligase [Micrococcus]OFR86665.1 Pup--protein ligase [Micrococcus sp. HMSC067E09]PNL18024.1 Pup--protein ligase [Micrococcus sp. FDAARGOS_333]TFH98060.1 Pup--protein ligase [Micrococcus lylae]WIK82919.1 Pup--protein ligase [Micrococcus lylae]SJN16006.1 Pup ligase PafA, possible component of postulated heterodimer PafA-PafA' [Micrococcus lylae]